MGCHRVTPHYDSLVDQVLSQFFQWFVRPEDESVLLRLGFEPEFTGTAFQRSIESFLSLVRARRNDISSAIQRERKEANGYEHIIRKKDSERIQIPCTTR